MGTVREVGPGGWPLGSIEVSSTDITITALLRSERVTKEGGGIVEHGRTLFDGWVRLADGTGRHGVLRWSGNGSRLAEVLQLSGWPTRPVGPTGRAGD